MSKQATGNIPQTMFELAGVKLEPAKLSNSVLVIIDAQREYLDGALPLPGIHSALAEIGGLLARARQAGTPVVFIKHKGAGVFFNPDSPSFEIVASLKPLAGETVIEKTRVSAFAATSLESVLQGLGRKNLIITGFITHNCVSSTTRSAMDLGYVPTVVGAATATRDLPDGVGGVLPAAVVQTASLAALADRNAVIVSKAGDIVD